MECCIVEGEHHSDESEAQKWMKSKNGSMVTDVTLEFSREYRLVVEFCVWGRCDDTSW